jgi:hypothetical protein
MRLTIQRQIRAATRRFGPLLVIGLVLGSRVPVAAAFTPLPPPEIMRIDDLKDGSINLVWKMVSYPCPKPPAGSRTAPPCPNVEDPWGYRFNVYIEQTGELIHTETRAPRPAENFTTEPFSYHADPDEFFDHHGTTKETRYCITMQSYVGDGHEATSAFSGETRRKCVGTQSVLIVTPGEPLPPSAPPPPPPPTKPDLVVMRVTGPTSLAANTTATYEVALWNDGTPAKDTAQIQILLMGQIEPVEVTELTNGSFTCGQNDFGYVCKGSLGGLNDPLGTRGALFRVQVHGNASGGSATVGGSANHDRALDEVSVDNNLKTVDVTVF